MACKMNANALTWVEDPAALEQITQSVTCRQVKERIEFWMNRFFKFDKGKYSIRSKHLEHDWYIGGGGLSPGPLLLPTGRS